MRENRPYGSEGGEGTTLPDPIVRFDSWRAVPDNLACGWASG
jgi:hypothetical protein